MPGVMKGFAEHVDPSLGAHLRARGPGGRPASPTIPRAPRCSTSAWPSGATLPHAARSRVHLACVPMADPDENAAIVNALQRHAHRRRPEEPRRGLRPHRRRGDVEAPAGRRQRGRRDRRPDRGRRSRPARGRSHRSTGLRRCRRDASCATARLAARLAENAHMRIADEFLGDRHLEQYCHLFEQLAPHTRQTISKPEPGEMLE